MTLSDPRDPSDPAQPPPWLCKAVVQETRAAATRGLLHDFSNVMVGLCSISENAVEDAEEGTPLRDDLEIIRDSAMRAYQLIRRIVALNPVDPVDADLIDCEAWLRNEVDSLRAVLPKGSEVRLDQSCESILFRATESDLRDGLLMIAHQAARRHRKRVSMRIVTRKLPENVEIEVVDSAMDSGPVHMDDSEHELLGEVDVSSILDCCARQLGGSCQVETHDDGSQHVFIRLPRAVL